MHPTQAGRPAVTAEAGDGQDSTPTPGGSRETGNRPLLWPPLAAATQAEAWARLLAADNEIPVPALTTRSLRDNDCLNFCVDLVRPNKTTKNASEKSDAPARSAPGAGAPGCEVEQSSSELPCFERKTSRGASCRALPRPSRCTQSRGRRAGCGSSRRGWPQPGDALPQARSLGLCLSPARAGKEGDFIRPLCRF